MALQSVLGAGVYATVAVAYATLVASGDAFAPHPSALGFARQAGFAHPLRATATGRRGLRGYAARSARTPLQLQSLFGIGGSGKKKVGVIGATGGVGRLTVAYLLEQGLRRACLWQPRTPLHRVLTTASRWRLVRRL